MAQWSTNRAKRGSPSPVSSFVSAPHEAPRAPLTPAVAFDPTRTGGQAPAEDLREVTVAFRARVYTLPALRSAIDEISQEIGGRLEGAHLFTKEAALTRAAMALGALRAAVNALAAEGDPDYDARGR